MYIDETNLTNVTGQTPRPKESKETGAKYALLLKATQKSESSNSFNFKETSGLT